MQRHLARDLAGKLQRLVGVVSETCSPRLSPQGSPPSAEADRSKEK